VVERWIGIALAATSVLQLLGAELMSRKTGEFGQKYFDDIIKTDENNELGLPAQPEQCKRLTSEVYRTAQLAADGATILAAEIAAIAGMVATFVITAQGKKPWAAWASGIATLVLVVLAVALIVQFLTAKLSRYVVGEPMHRWKKTKDEEPSAPRRLSNNVRAALSGYFQRVRKLQTLTPYKTSIISAAILSAVIGVLI
jgi:hypothetical protein